MSSLRVGQYSRAPLVGQSACFSAQIRRSPALFLRLNIVAFRNGTNKAAVKKGQLITSDYVSKKATKEARSMQVQQQSIAPLPPAQPVMMSTLGGQVIGGMILLAGGGSTAWNLIKRSQGQKELQDVENLTKAVTQATREAQAKLGTSLGEKERELKVLLESTKVLEAEVSSGGGKGLSSPPQLTSGSQVAPVTDAAKAMKESQRKVALLEAMVTTLRVRLREEEDRTSRLSDEVEVGQEELHRANSQRLELELRVVQLKQELDDAAERLLKAEANSNELEAHVIELKSHNVELETRVRELEGTLDKRTREAEEVARAAEMRILELTSEADSTSFALARLQDALDTREQQLEDMKRIVDSNKASAAQMEAILETNDGEMLALSSSLRNSVEEAMSLYHQRDKELSLLKVEMGKLQAQADGDGQRRSTELGEVKNQLEEQLASARSEAQSAKDELTLIKRDMDSLLQDDLPDMLRDLQKGKGPGPKWTPLGPATGFGVPAGDKGKQPNLLMNMSIDELSRAMQELTARESRLMTEIWYRQEEMTQQRRLLAPRLKVELIGQVQDLETCVAALRAQTRKAEEGWEIDGVGAQTVSRLRREMASVSNNLSALYRSAMSPEMRDRERSLASEVQDREVEVKAMAAQIARHQEQLKIRGMKNVLPWGAASQRGSSSSKDKAGSSSMSSAVRKRLQVLIDEQEKVTEKAQAAREKERERELQARLEASEEAYKAQVSEVQQQLSAQIRSLEDVWKAQLSASQKALAETENAKMKLAAEATISAVQVRQQLLELQSLKEDLSDQGRSLREMQNTYENNRHEAENRMGASQMEMANVAKEVLKLQEQLRIRETEMVQLASKKVSNPPDFPSPWPPVPLPEGIHKEKANRVASNAQATTSGGTQPAASSNVSTPTPSSSPLSPASTPGSLGAQDAWNAQDTRALGSEPYPPPPPPPPQANPAPTAPAPRVSTSRPASASAPSTADAVAAYAAMLAQMDKPPQAPPKPPSAAAAPPPTPSAPPQATSAPADAAQPYTVASNPPTTPAAPAPPSSTRALGPKPPISAWGRPKIDSASNTASNSNTPSPPQLPPPPTAPQSPPALAPDSAVSTMGAPTSPESTTAPASPSAFTGGQPASWSAPSPNPPAVSPFPTAPPSASPPPPPTPGAPAGGPPPVIASRSPAPPTPFTPGGDSTSASVFHEDDELNSMVASITQNLLQRGGAGPSQPALTSQAGSSPFIGQTSQGFPPSQAKGPRQVAKFKLVSGSHMIPHADKVAKGGEDAWFTSTAGCGAVGVADGVGGWAEEDINPAEYARAVTRKCEEAVQDTDWDEDSSVIDILEFAQASISSPGSCTVCLAVLRPTGVLDVANLGDAGVRVIRGTKLAFSTTAQEHQFNMPYQMASPGILPDTDMASDAMQYQFELRQGDVVITGSDGLFDNMWDDQLVAQVYGYVQSVQREAPSSMYVPWTAQQLAKAIAIAASATIRDSSARTPWSVESASQNQQQTSLFGKLFARGGGKMDDITVLVSIVGPATSTSAS